MKRSCIYIIIFLNIFTTGCVKKEGIQNFISNSSNSSNYNATMKQDILSLMMAYPEYIIDVKKDADDKVYIIMKSGKKILYDDKRKKNYQEKLNNPDLQDMMEQIYPLSDINKLMEEDFDPGRIRVYSLFREVYGSSNQEINRNLVNVKINYKNYPFNKKNNASMALQLTMNEVLKLAQNKNDIWPFLLPISGTFNYRLIAGTNRLSPHSFGTAIDLKRNNKDYWKWASRDEGQKRLKSYPKEIVRTFENNNFIWGGKWSHFDILHFEYRPELIFKAKYFSSQTDINKSWYEGVLTKNNKIERYIDMIDESIK